MFTTCPLFAQVPIDSLTHIVQYDSLNLTTNGKAIVSLEYYQDIFYPESYGQCRDDLKKIIKETNDEKLESELNLIEAKLLSYHGDFLSSVGLTHNVLNFSLAINDTALIIRGYVLLSNLNNRQTTGNVNAHPELALEYAEKAVCFASAYDDSNITSLANQNAASVFCNIKQYQTAKCILESNLSIILQNLHGIDKDIALVYNHYLMGMVNKHSENYPQAKLYFMSSNSIAEAQCIRRVFLLSQYQLGVVSMQMQDFAKAEQFLLSSYDMSNFMSLSRKLPIIKSIQNLYEHKGDLTRAIIWSDTYMRINDAVYEKEKMRLYSDFQVRYQTNKKDKEITQLKLENEIISNRESVFKWWTLAGSFIILILGINLFYLFTKKIQTEKALLKKELLFSMLTHDLRSPLVGLKCLLPSVKSSIKVNNLNLGYELLNQAHENILKLYNLVENVFNDVKLKEKSNKTHFRKFDVNQEIHAIVQDFEHKIIQKNIKIKLDLCQPAETVGDRLLIQLVIRNILDNAVKYSFEDSEVHIACQKKDSNLIVKYTDFGIGIPNEKIANLFCHNCEISCGTSGEKGSGIGLSLCKRIMHLHKGDLIYRNENNSTNFYMIVPI